MGLNQMKYIIVVGDGMADEPLEALNGKTPLEVSHTPNMDFFAENGIVGQVQTVPEGMPAGSDVANLSLLGYSPLSHYTGRAPLEAASMGVEMGPEDVAFRCNLVTLEKQESNFIMADYSGGSISSEKAKDYIEILNNKLAGPDFCFYPGVSYRHLLLWKGAKKRFEQLKTTPPHDIIGQLINPHLPKGMAGKEIVSLMNEGFKALESKDIAKGSANSIWLWGQGHAAKMPLLSQRFGLQGATVSAVDLIKGIGRCAGLDSLNIPGVTGDLDTNFQGKAYAALKALKELDFVFLHIEAPDEASHRGNIQEKISAIEMLDDQVLGVLRKGFSKMNVAYRLLLLPDHATPIRSRTHSCAPVPFLLYTNPPHLSPASLKQGNSRRVDRFTENEVEKTGIFFREGHRMVEILFQ